MKLRPCCQGVLGGSNLRRQAEPTPGQTQWLSGKQKEHKLKLLGPDIFWWGGGLPREWGGGSKVRYAAVCPGNQTFDGMSSDCCWDIPGVPENFERKVVLSSKNLGPYNVC